MITTEEVIRAAAKEIEEIFTIKDTNKNARLEQLEKENSLLRAEVESLHKVIGSVRDLCNKSIIEPTVKQPIPESWKSLQDKIRAVKPLWRFVPVSKWANVHYHAIDGVRIFQIAPDKRGFIVYCISCEGTFADYTASDEDDVVRIMVTVALDYEKKEPVETGPTPENANHWNSLRDKIGALGPSWTFVLTSDNVFMATPAVSDGVYDFRITRGKNGFLIQPSYLGSKYHTVKTFTASDEENVIRIMIREANKESGKTPTANSTESVNPEKWKSLQDKIKSIKPSWVCITLSDRFTVTNESSEGPRGFQITHYANTGGFLVQPTFRESKIAIEPSTNLFHGYNVVTFIARDEDHAVGLIVNNMNAL